MKNISSSLGDLIQEKDSLKEIKNSLLKEGVIIIKETIEFNFLSRVVSHLEGIMKNTIPVYHPISKEVNNFYRVNFEDNRSYVKGHFHQFNFFPWNQDLFNFYKVFREIFELKNLLNDLKKDTFLDGSDMDFVPKLSFHFYDSGKGFMQRHQDPIGDHQFVLPILVMSSKGIDFNEGGLEVKIKKNWEIIDDHVEVGDLILMKGDLPHGVQMIDPNKEFKNFSSGRWMGLFAINKVQGSLKVPDSKIVV